VGVLVLLRESRTMRWKMCSSVRILLCDAGERSPVVLNLGQDGGGGECLGCWVGVLLTEDLVRVAPCSVLTVLDRF